MIETNNSINQIKLCGTVASTVGFSHETKWERFYRFYLAVPRKSGSEDILRCIVPEVYLAEIAHGKKICVNGNIRTHYETSEEKRHLIVDVFVNGVEPTDDIHGEYNNSVLLKGYLISDNNYRETGTGRKICDVLLSVGRVNSKKSDFIPCIAWGRDAERIALCDKGQLIICSGRLQSRKYIKRYGDGFETEKTAYEFSIARFKECEE